MFVLGKSLEGQDVSPNYGRIIDLQYDICAKNTNWVSELEIFKWNCKIKHCDINSNEDSMMDRKWIPVTIIEVSMGMIEGVTENFTLNIFGIHLGVNVIAGVNKTKMMRMNIERKGTRVRDQQRGLRRGAWQHIVLVCILQLIQSFFRQVTSRRLIIYCIHYLGPFQIIH